MPHSGTDSAAGPGPAGPGGPVGHDHVTVVSADSDRPRAAVTVSVPMTPWAISVASN